jgi:acetolactate synthase-1/2/3 large subunit
VLSLATPEEDVEGALEALAASLDAPAPAFVAAERPELADGELSAETIGATLALLQPEGAIVVDESATTGLGYFPAAAGSPRHSLLTLTGGSIGMGPPCATGAAIACPDRTVINFQGDGGAMYTVQALWTQAREQLHVVTLICANRAYRILQVESARAGVADPGAQALALTELARPPLDWVQLASGMGVHASRVDSVVSLRRALSAAIEGSGPHLIEMTV